MNEHAATGICGFVDLDADVFVETPPEHLPGGQDHKLLEVAFSKYRAERDHGCTSSKIADNEFADG